jgi:exonuclease III
MDMRFGTWNVRSMYRAGSLRAIAEELSKYNLDLVGVQEVRWDAGGTEPASKYTFFYGKWNENHELGRGFSYIRESCQQLRGWSSLVIGCHT